MGPTLCDTSPASVTKRVQYYGEKAPGGKVALQRTVSRLEEVLPGGSE